MVVKQADTEKDKAQKRMQTIASNMFGLGLSMQLAQGNTNNLGMAANTYQQVSFLMIVFIFLLPGTGI